MRRIVSRSAGLLLVVLVLAGCSREPAEEASGEPVVAVEQQLHQSKVEIMPPKELLAVVPAVQQTAQPVVLVETPLHKQLALLLVLRE